MRRDPPISLRGALEILGHHDRSWLDRLNGLLGGAVLATGAAPATAAVSAVWGWVDQKNEAASLVRRVLDGVSDRLLRTGGLERHELVVAAHTTIVVSSFFEALREELRDLYDEVAFTDREKVMVAGDSSPVHDSLVRQLYTTPVPTPSAAFGFEENTKNLRVWVRSALTGVAGFMHGLDLSTTLFGDWSGVADGVVARYRSNYLALASTVPEFEVWADRTEHAATRSAMARLESVLSVVADAVPLHDLRAVLRDVNRSALRQPVINVDTDGYGIDAVFPAVEDIFIAPDYRLATATGDTDLASESWWAARTVHTDLDLLFARHFSTLGSTELPLLLLGHPGSGKSLITQVVAARLPDEAYTVVRVPLRRVDANASIPAQVQQALDQATHGRVSWPELADQSADVIRVVLLDGLDELLQTTTQDRADFLHQVVEFQRVESVLRRPVAVVVTSRTLVADRVSVPNGTPVVKLEEFDEPRIRRWVDVWNETNLGRLIRPMSADTAMAHVDLARQPLLLLMLALYYADPHVDAAEHLSRSLLYERLFETFAQREVTKRAGRVLRGDDRRNAVDRQLHRLSTAALGMFNRGRQDITEEDLGADLAVLDGEPPPGGRLLAEFFFIHSPEAVTDRARRSYEFLHATFGEYLVAARVVDVLRDTARSAADRRYHHELDDDLLFALLSHQPLAVRQPVLSFATDLLTALGEEERGRIAETLELLISGYRERKPSQSFADYHPTAPDSLRALAAYSVNLVLLRARLTEEGVPLSDLWPEDSLGQWRSAVDLWRAGLETSSYHALLTAVDLVDGERVVHDGLAGAVASVSELQHARLRHDPVLLSQLRLGFALQHRGNFLVLKGSEENRAREYADWLMSWFTAAHTCPTSRVPDFIITDLTFEIDEDQRSLLTNEAVALLPKVYLWGHDFAQVYVAWLREFSSWSHREVVEGMLERVERKHDREHEAARVMVSLPGITYVAHPDCDVWVYNPLTRHYSE